MAETQTGSTSESVITETRRTTESTMKMEHKMDFPDLTTSFSQRPKTPTIAENRESLYHAKFVPDPLAEPIHLEPIKQNAFQFFESNLKNFGPNNEEKYTRYEDMVKTKSSTFSQDNNQQFQSQLNNDLNQLNLEPGSPPLEGFMPKTVLNQNKIPNMAPNSGLPQTFRKEEFVKESRQSSSSFKQQSFAPAQILTPKLEPMRINRSPSPRPEALEMEKLWSTKSPEPHLAQSFMASQQSFHQENHKSFVAYSTPPQHFHQVPMHVNFEQQHQQVAPEPEIPKLSIKETKKMFENKIRQEELSVLKSPALVKEFSKPEMPPPSQFQPGAPPEMCYAPKPMYERKQSQVERIEKSLEESLDKEPSYVPRGGVRIIPARQPTPQRSKFSQSPSRSRVSPSPQPTHAARAITPPSFETVQSSFDSEISSKIMKEHITSPYVAPAFTPIPIDVKADSDDAANLQGYRRVAPPQLSNRQKSVEPQAVPPTQFEIPKAPEVVFRPVVQIQAARPEPIIKKLEPIYPQVQQPKPINPSQFNKVAGTNSLYKSFVKSEERVESSESYFRQTDMKSPTPTPQATKPKMQSPSPLYGQQVRFVLFAMCF